MSKCGHSRAVGNPGALSLVALPPKGNPSYGGYKHHTAQQTPLAAESTAGIFSRGQQDKPMGENLS